MFLHIISHIFSLNQLISFNKCISSFNVNADLRQNVLYRVLGSELTAGEVSIQNDQFLAIDFSPLEDTMNTILIFNSQIAYVLVLQ